MGQEELAALKRERVNRSLSFSPAIGLDTTNEDVDMLGNDSDGVLRVSCKQVRRDSLSVKLSSEYCIILKDKNYEII